MLAVIHMCATTIYTSICETIDVLPISLIGGSLSAAASYLRAFNLNIIYFIVRLCTYASYIGNIGIIV